MTQLKIASFNVNSIKARLPRLLEWLRKSQPDVVLLQELKCIEEEFPFEALFDLGYNAVVHGQKTYNGVAILSKYKIEDVVKGLPGSPLLGGSESLRSTTMGGSLSQPLLGGSESLRSTTMGGSLTKDEQARYIEGVISVSGKAIRVSSIYVPNGGGDLMPNETLESSKKFLYKLDFYDRLRAHLSNLLDYNEIQIFGGDFNVAREEIDLYDPKSFANQILFHPLELQKFRALINLGLIDSFRATHPKTQSFSWWDYRGNGWQHNKGVRIDYLLASPLAADLITSATIEAEGVRDQEKPSDHCPVCLTLLP